MAKQLVAITGATGFLGRFVLKAVCEKGYAPVAVVRDVASARLQLPANIEIRQADVTDETALVNAFHGVQTAIHLAGMVSVNKCDDQAVNRVNVLGAQNFLNAVEKAEIDRAIFTSTTSAVAALSQNNPDLACDETVDFNLACEPVAYIQAKRKAHKLALKAKARGLPIVILSPSFVLGPDDINSNTSELVDAVRKKELPVCPYGGVNPIDVRDVAQAYVAALEHPNPAPHYILASHENLTLKDFIGHVAALAGVSPPRISLPNSLVLAVATIAETLFPTGGLTAAGARLGSYYWYFNAALARRDLSLNCRSLDETLKATLSWLITREGITTRNHKLEQT